MKLDNDIHNYYEYLVIEHLTHRDVDQDPDYIADLCCLVLNQLPPRYIRYQVDMAFYLPKHERIEMEIKVKEAIDRSIDYLNKMTDRETPLTTFPVPPKESST